MVSSEYKKITEYITRLGRGDKTAFADIYTMYERRVYFLCCKLTGRKLEAEDLTRETFIYVYNNINSISNPAVFDKWLYVAASNRCKIFLKRADAEKYASYEDSDAEGSVSIEDMMNADAETAARNAGTFKITVDKMKAADRIIGAMPDKLRIAYMHCYFSGLSLDEIAQVEGISLNAVKNRLIAARDHIQAQVDLLAQNGIDMSFFVCAAAYMFETMSSSVRVPGSIAASVSAQLGINCVAGEPRTYETGAGIPFTAQRTQPDYPAPPQPDETEDGEDDIDEDDEEDDEDVQSVHRPEKMSPTVKILIGIICVLVVAIGVIAVVIFAGGKKDDNGTTNDAPTTAATTERKKETTTIAETTTVPETTTQPETTTKSETTTQPVAIVVTENNNGQNNNGDNNNGNNTPDDNNNNENPDNDNNNDNQNPPEDNGNDPQGE